MTSLNEIERGQLCQTTIESLYKATGGLRHFPGLLKKIIREKAWECRVDRGKTIKLANLHELITAKPLAGWGDDPDKVASVIKDDPEAAEMFREEMLGTEGGDKRSDTTGNNITSDGRVTGTSRAYSISRVRRDAPQFLDAVMKKEMTPNAALVKAGIRDNRQVYIPREPEKGIAKLLDRFGEEFVREMLNKSPETLAILGASVHGEA